MEKAMDMQSRLDQSQKVQNYQLLQGRLAAAKWLSMSEPEVGKAAAEIESDPLYKELVYGVGGLRPIVRRNRWPASSIHGSFYEVNERTASGSGGSGDISDLIENREGLIRLVRKIGRENFERYFLYGEEGRPLSEICDALGISEREGTQILELVLDVGTRSEFFTPGKALAASGVRYSCVAEIERDPRSAQTLFFRFFAPHWARGKYVIDYERLEEWKTQRGLESGEGHKLRVLLKRIEMLNMRQDTLYKILSRISTEQSGYLLSRNEARLRPLSLREMARRIEVAPSTVSRAVSNRSVRVPWGEEMPIKSLLTGQRHVILSVLKDWMDGGRVTPEVTDEELMRRLAEDAGINVSRRTVNECRRKLLGR